MGQKNLCHGQAVSWTAPPASCESPTKFYLQSTRFDVCRKAFCEVHGLGNHTLRSLQEHVEAGLIVPPPHKLTGRPAKHAVSESVKHDITMFIKNYASSFGMHQPAAPRGTSGVAPTYLPASLSILELHGLYCDANPEG